MAYFGSTPSNQDASHHQDYIFIFLVGQGIPSFKPSFAMLGGGHIQGIFHKGSYRIYMNIPTSYL